MDSRREAKIIKEGKDRFDRCMDVEGQFRNLFVQDIQFCNADVYNGYQWDMAVQQRRGNSPCLTINKTRQYCLQIINDARQNKSQIRVRPVSDEATYQAADVFEGVVRHIEYISNAQSAYDSATVNQVQGGIGYWRVCTDYKDNRSNEQEIFIRRIKDPMSVFLDPDIREEDGSDARFGFIFDDIPRDLFDQKYPEYKNQVASVALGNRDDWVTKDYVRVAEYYRKRQKRDELITDAKGNSFLRSEIGAEIAEKLKEDPAAQSRKIIDDEIEWFLIVGDEIAETTKWAGKYIPIVRAIGEETFINGVLDRKGHTRALIDPNRMYNFWASEATAQVALQTKSPYIAPALAIEGLEEYWRNANTENASVLPYKSVDDQGRPIPPPAREQPPVMAQAYLQGLQIAEQQMQMVSGQYQAMMGEPSNEKSGRAINERQRQGDNATYHYIDNLAKAIRFTGKILIDLIPKIYDTARVVMILAENGDRSAVHIDPTATVAHQQVPAPQGPTAQDQAKVIFNPSVGEYDVESDIGPAYATKRQEAFDAFLQLVTASPILMEKAGDLMFRAADFPMADDIAERLQPGPSQQVMMLQQQLQKMQGMLAQSMQSLAEEKTKRSGQEQQKGIDAYKAVTDRLNVVKDLDPTAVSVAGRQAAAEALSSPLAPIDQSIDAALQAMPIAPVQQQGMQQGSVQ